MHAQRRMQKSWGVAKAATFMTLAMKSTTKNLSKLTTVAENSSGS